MLQITSIINYPNQTQTLNLPDGTFITMHMSFSPQQQGWFIRELTYQNFTLNGLRIVNSPNMLHQFRNQIPFGLACFSTADREPQLQPDFSSNASVMFILTQEEVMQYAEFLSAG